MHALETRDLSAGYSGRRILHELSVQVRAGEVLVLVGPNGAGKTTLLRSLARLLLPERGCVLLEGTDVWQHGPAWLAQRLALAPQAAPSDWPGTVAEAVLLGRAVHRGWLLPFTAADRACVESALERTGLLALRDRPLATLSGGEAQRVLLARALVQEPAVFLLDEPTAHLDLRHQMEVLSLVQRLAHQDHLAVVLALHDLNQAALWADRVALLVDGRLIGLAPPAEVLTAERLSAAYGLPIAVTHHPVYQTLLIAPLPPGGIAVRPERS